MEIITRCPNCGMELEAPDEMIGSPALCPGCQRPFVVQPVSETSMDESGGRSEASAGSGPSVPSAASPATTNGARSEQRQRRDEKSTKNQTTSPSPTDSASPQAAPGKPRFKGLDADLMAELGGQATAATPSNEPRTTSAAPAAKTLTDFQPASATPVRADRPNKRERKVARLVTGGDDVAKLTLGADGQLPQLVIKETTTTEKRRTEESESSPTMLIIAVAMSVGLSLLLLFVPTTGRSSKTDVADSLAALQEHYIGSRQPLEPYQLLIRQALQAENKGDRRTATGIYRRLLEMLHEERPNRNQGLTGPTLSTREPNDRQLEAHLRTLLTR